MRVATPERLQRVCKLIPEGQTEEAACICCGISNSTWNAAKRSEPDLREQIIAARDERARGQHQHYIAERYERQVARSAGRKAKPPQPTRQAKWVCHYLAVTVPLNLASIPPAEIEEACARCNLSLENWRRQERAFGLLRKIYEKRASLRGQQSVVVPSMSCSAEVESDPFAELLGY